MTPYHDRLQAGHYHPNASWTDQKPDPDEHQDSGFMMAAKPETKPKTKTTK